MKPSLAIVAVLLLVGCSDSQPPVAAPGPAAEPAIIGGMVDFETNTFTDERTGKVYSLSDEVVDEATMSAHYPSDEEIANKPPTIVPMEFKASTELPEELRDFKAFKVEDGKLFILSTETKEWEQHKKCPANNTILELSYEDAPDVKRWFQFKSMKWSEIEGLPTQ